MTDAPDRRLEAVALAEFSAALFRAAGLAADRARDVAEVLLEGDLLGHATHGLALVPPYLQALREGGMTRLGEPEIVADQGSAVTWDGRLLPGPWLVRRAIALATARLARHPVATIVIRRSHHIACLQAYLAPVVARGQVILLTCSDPAHRSVAPFGAVEGVVSPNPIAAGFPTDAGPVLIDVSTSTTAFGHVMRAARAGERLPGPWLVAPDGSSTDEAAAALDARKAPLHPLGGEDLGYKGFALSLIVEALTNALGGHGRAATTDRWSASVFLQIIDPARFGGAEGFARETGFLAQACREARVARGRPAVRLPGDGALARRAESLARGVALPPGVQDALIAAAQELAVPVPAPLS
ncbi:MAG: Ldh family oxidoreductase [Opitutaceae bacterium]|nr:Ldh family oxidoreductase [Opitutaceae bacterium]